MPRIIASIDAAPAGGRFWLEPDSGRVIRSELVVDSGNARAQDHRNIPATAEARRLGADIDG